MLAVLVICLLLALLGLLLGQASHRFREDRDPIIERIDALLPQTQCAQCGFPGCRPYATAIATGRADINQCPPGGEDTVTALAALLGLEPKTLDVSTCIGCTLCIQACPVDAIVGAPRFMHTVIAAECTGCELCLAPCPVDCISLEPAETLSLGHRFEPAPIRP